LSYDITYIEENFNAVAPKMIDAYKRKNGRKEIRKISTRLSNFIEEFGSLMDVNPKRIHECIQILNDPNLEHLLIFIQCPENRAFIDSLTVKDIQNAIDVAKTKSIMNK
jgi:hypothetical protein